jgi:hypothetical protein
MNDLAEGPRCQPFSLAFGPPPLPRAVRKRGEVEIVASITPTTRTVAMGHHCCDRCSACGGTFDSAENPRCIFTVLYAGLSRRSCTVLPTLSGGPRGYAIAARRSAAHGTPRRWRGNRMWLSVIPGLVPGTHSRGCSALGLGC